MSLIEIVLNEDDSDLREEYERTGLNRVILWWIRWRVTLSREGGLLCFRAKPHYPQAEFSDLRKTRA